MAVTTTALIVSGLTVGNAYMNYRAGKAAAKAAEKESEYQAEVFGRNADLADEQAVDAIARGRESEMALRRKSRGLAASQRAGFAAQGLDMNSGSAQDVIQNDLALGELDAITIANNAQREALGFRKQAEYDRKDADFARAGGKNRAQALYKEGIGTLLTAATSIAGTLSSGRNGAPRYQPDPYRTASGARRGGPI